MILALHEMTPQASKRQEAIDIFLSIKSHTAFKPGCISAGLLSGIDDSKLLYVEKWKSMQEFTCHLKSVEYLRILNALEFASEPPTVRFYDVVDENGMSLIEQLRHDAGLTAL